MQKSFHRRIKVLFIPKIFQTLIKSAPYEEGMKDVIITDTVNP